MLQSSGLIRIEIGPYRIPQGYVFSRVRLPREFDALAMLPMARIDRVQREGQSTFRHLSQDPTVGLSRGENVGDRRQIDQMQVAPFFDRPVVGVPEDERLDVLKAAQELHELGRIPDAAPLFPFGRRFELRIVMC